MVTEKQPLDTDREGFFKVKKKKKKVGKEKWLATWGPYSEALN